MKKTTILIILLSLFTLGCTENQRARKYGGEQTIDLDPFQRLKNVTWKGDNLWILTTRDSTNPKIYTLQEKSSFGILQGQIIINEY